MATSTELLRAAEHMRGQDKAIAEREAHDEFGRSQVAYWVRNVADALEREGQRLQDIEAQQPKRSWPEGWPPFAVLRRAYEMLDMPFAVLRRAYERLEVFYCPSTRWLEKHGGERSKQECISIRERWAELLIEESSAP